MMPQAAHAATAASSTARHRPEDSVDGTDACGRLSVDVIIWRRKRGTSWSPLLSLGSTGAARAASRATRRRPGGEPRAEEDERAVAVSRAQALDANAARILAVRADDHDVVAVAQVFVVAVVGARIGGLIVGQRVGHVLG